MKKVTLVLALALIFVAAFAMSAMAEQSFYVDPHTASEAVNPDNNTSYVNTADTAITWPVNSALNRIHSNYVSNTNACASCHATHTGVGEALLQWESAQAACLACHDGTAGTHTYDVVNGDIADTTSMTFGGRFMEGATNGSMHDVLHENQVIGDAPGGDRFNAGTTGSKWNTTFECVSCHDPHGTAGNARILNPNPNSVQAAITSDLVVEDAALKVYFAQGQGVNGKAYFMPGHSYSVTIKDKVAGTDISSTNYTLDSTAGYTKVTFKPAFTVPGGGVTATYTPALRVTMDVQGYLTAGETVTYKTGMNAFCGACHTDYDTENTKLNSDGTAKAAGWSNGNPITTGKAGNDTSFKSNGQLTVKDSTDSLSYLAFFGPNSGSPAITGAGAGAEITGTYHDAYRHQVGFTTSSGAARTAKGLKFEDQKVYYTKDGTNWLTTTVSVVTCTTCHVAHGTDDTVWTGLSNKATVTDADKATRFNGALETRGSALKRMPAMAVCETCHDKKGGNAGYGQF